MKKINLAVIGYGGMGGWHAQHALDSDVVQLVGVYDIKPEQNVLAESRGIHAYASLEAVLADPQVELVTVATPNDDHESICIRALEAGKHVICEKPVTLDCIRLQRMIDTANRTGRIFSVHQNRRWDTDFLAIKQLLDSGELGDMIRIENRVQGSRGIPGDWRGLKKHGGGMLYDWGVHLIDQILLLMPDPVQRIDCRFDHITNTEVDDGFRLDMTFADGRSAYVEVGTHNFISMPRFYLRCQEGSALIAGWREPCQVVKCIHWHQNDVLPVKTAAGLTKTMAPRDEVTTESYTRELPKADVHDYYRNIVRAIAGEEASLITHAQLMRVMRVIETAFRSAEENQVISCNI